MHALSTNSFEPKSKHLKTTSGNSLCYGLLSANELNKEDQVTSLLISDQRGMLHTECLTATVNISTSDLYQAATKVADAINAGWMAFTIGNALILKNKSDGIEFNNGSIVASTVEGKVNFNFGGVSEGRDPVARWYDVIYEPDTVIYTGAQEPVELQGFFHEIYDPENDVRVLASKEVFFQDGLYYIESFPFGSSKFKNCYLKDIGPMESIFVAENATVSIVSDRSDINNTIFDAFVNLNAINATIRNSMFVNGSQNICDIHGSVLDNVTIDGGHFNGSIINSTFQNIALINTQARFDVNLFEFLNYTMNEAKTSYNFDNTKGSISIYKDIDMIANASIEVGMLPNNAMIYEMISYGENLTTNDVQLKLLTDKEYGLIETIQFSSLAGTLKTISSGLSVVKSNSLAKIIIKDITGVVTQGHLSIIFNYIKYS